MCSEGASSIGREFTVRFLKEKRHGEILTLNDDTHATYSAYRQHQVANSAFCMWLFFILMLVQ